MTGSLACIRPSETATSARRAGPRHERCRPSAALRVASAIGFACRSWSTARNKSGRSESAKILAKISAKKFGEKGRYEPIPDGLTD